MIQPDHYIDSLFRKKISRMHDLPAGIGWNSRKGWSQYREQFPAGKGRVNRLPVYLGAAAAAIIIMLLAVIYHRYPAGKSVLFSNQTSEIKEIILPDGNAVWLNRQSSVRYPSSVDEKQYDIIVDGEAYIEINQLKSERYTITAQNARVFVDSPSSFNIKARTGEENTDITVASGLVTIADESYREGLALLVTHGNYCSVHRSRKLVYTAKNINDNYLAWKTGKLIFCDQPMATVTDILSQYYGRTIELEDPSIAYCLFSGTFVEKPIDIILDQIRTDLNLTIIDAGSKITFSGEGCL